MRYFNTSYTTGPGSWHSPGLVSAAKNRAAWQAQQMMPRVTGRPNYRGTPVRRRPAQSKGQYGMLPKQRGAGVVGRPGGGSAGLGMNGGSLQQLIGEYKKAHERANAANQSRYEAIRGGANDNEAAMGGYQGRYKKAMDLANLAANQQYRNASAASNQDLISRGLRASTEATKGQFDAYERAQQIPLQTHMAASGDQLAFMERKNEPGPSMDQLVNLSMMAGAQSANQQIPQQLAMIRQLLGARGGGPGGVGLPQVRNQPYLAGLNFSGPQFMPFMTSGRRGYGQSNLPSQRPGFNGRPNQVRAQNNQGEGERNFNPLRTARNVGNGLRRGTSFLGGLFGGGSGGGDVSSASGDKPFVKIKNDTLGWVLGEQLTNKQVEVYRKSGIPIVTNPNAEGSGVKPGDYYIDAITRVVKKY